MARRPQSTPQNPGRVLQLDDDRYAQVENALIDAAIGHKVLLRVRRRNTKAREYQLVWAGEDDLCDHCQERLDETLAGTETWYAYDDPPSDSAQQYVMNHELGRPREKEHQAEDRQLTLVFARKTEEEVAAAQAIYKPPAETEEEPKVSPEEDPPLFPGFGLGPVLADPA